MNLDKIVRLKSSKSTEGKVHLCGKLHIVLKSYHSSFRR